MFGCCQVRRYVKRADNKCDILILISTISILIHLIQGSAIFWRHMLLRTYIALHLHFGLGVLSLGHESRQGRKEKDEPGRLVWSQ